MSKNQKQQEEILRTLQDSRSEFVLGVKNLRSGFKISNKVKRSIVNYSLWAVGGVAIVGFLTVFFFPFKKKDKQLKECNEDVQREREVVSSEAQATKKFGLFTILIAIGRWFFPIVQPLLTSYATEKVSEYAKKRFS